MYMYELPKGVSFSIPEMLEFCQYQEDAEYDLVFWRYSLMAMGCNLGGR